MKSGRETFLDRYSHMETDDLLSLYNSGGLTPEAYADLENVLRSHGVEPPERPTVSIKQREENTTSGWGSFGSWFFGAFAICLLASRIFLSNLPSPTNVAPGSAKDIVGRLFGDSVQFIIIFVVVSLVIVVFSRLTRDTRKGHMSKLLTRAVIVTFFIEVLLIYGGWYATSG